MVVVMKIYDFVMTPLGYPGYIAEVHAKGKTAKVVLCGYYPFNNRSVNVIDTYPIKKLVPMTREAAWKIAPRFPGIDV